MPLDPLAQESDVWVLCPSRTRSSVPALWNRFPRPHHILPGSGLAAHFLSTLRTIDTVLHKVPSSKMADEREYLTEWPIVRDDKFSPKRRRIGEPQGSSFNGVPSVHGRKYEECIGLEETSSGCDGRCCASFWPATVALARWWRKCCQRFIDLDVYQFPDSENPNTILKYMAR